MSSPDQPNQGRQGTDEAHDGETEPAVMPQRGAAVEQSETVVAQPLPIASSDESFQVTAWIEGAVESKEEPLEEVREGPNTEGRLLEAGDNSHLEVIESGASSQFARLVRGWESYVHNGTRHVQRGLQNLNITCGDGLTPRIGGQQADNGDEEDLFAPIVLRHTHSSPLNYSSMFDADEELPPPIGLDNIRRSSSTPSTSAFRQRSAGSAFGTNLRTMPNLSGPDDRSAFSLPMHRSSYTSYSDSGVRYSAFNPVALRIESEEIEKTSIEVMDIGVPEISKEKRDEQKWHAATKARKFLKDNLMGRRRRRRGGRENPGPSSVASSNSVDVIKRPAISEGETISGDSSGRNEVSVVISLNTCEEENQIDASNEDDEGAASPESETDDATHKISTSQHNASDYHQLDSDMDEEYNHYQRIEAVHDSPGTVPSLSYHQFVDGTPPTTVVRIQVSGRSTPPRLTQIPDTSSPQPPLMGRTPSQDSGADSPGTAMSTLTSNTSGHTTLGTSTSGTISSGRTTLSVVSETDREVMETNKTGRSFRLNQKLRRHGQKVESDGDGTLHSSSTASTTMHGYVALDSPGPLREGANLPSDRFFKESQLPSSRSGSMVSGSSSSASSGAAVSTTNRSTVGLAVIQREESQLSTSINNHFTASLDSVGHTESSNSTNSEDPPQFVSYLDRQISLQSADTAKTLSRGNVRSSPPVLIKRDSEECDSPARIVKDYRVIFEAAKPDSEKLFRPVKKRDAKFASRPPLSPIKGLRTPTTPEPFQRPDSTSPAFQQNSPPNIVDHRIRSDLLSKPYVLRSNPSRPGMVLVSPDRPSNPAVPESSLERSTTYRETSVEVENRQFSQEGLPVVTPEKDTS